MSEQPILTGIAVDGMTGSDSPRISFEFSDGSDMVLFVREPHDEQALCDAVHEFLHDYFDQQMCEIHRKQQQNTCPVCQCRYVGERLAKLETDYIELKKSLDRANCVRGAV